jgi:predicted nucleotidyltransferase/DNA-binding XRE family transcriptional regulator
MTSAARLLRETREQVGLTQAQLAERCGVTQSVISAYESGRREPSVPTLQRLIGGTGLRLELDVRSRHALPRHGLGAVLRRKKTRLHGVFARHGVTDVRVFGSAARGDDRPDSDIDFVVHTPEGFDLLDLAALVLELEAVLRVPVDVVPDTSVRPGVALEIESDAVPL